VPEVGVYSVDVAQIQRGQVTRTESTGFAVPYPSEYRFLGPDESILHRVASLTDGLVLRDPRAVFRPDGLTFEGKEWFPLWPWLLGIALLLFPFDVAMRRLNLPAGLIGRLLGTRRD
jgi:Ca-activated chloride channel homolog